uniref:Carboxylic ester hydrolase n=1 Tax=Hucho hucho TaxID=62062 RepID=A0A4W5PT83_9TELE
NGRLAGGCICSYLFLFTIKLGVVYTEGGMVQGKKVNSDGLFRTMDVFKGIPYADKPGIFEKPKRHPGWDGVLKATEFKPRCMQLNLLQSDTRGQEDCLYLNIWVPQGISVSTGLPVMVWIFGGGYLVGGSMGANFLDNYLYDGEEIANRGKVIVVTLGYRVGTLGFLSSGDASGPGNYGLWDQHAAIAWVNRNIRAFGGDPNNITVFGESAGAASVSFQMLSPHNKGLIRRAISQSGVALCPWAINNNPRTFAEMVAEKVGCPIDDQMMACLKLINAKELTLAGTLSLAGSPSTPIVGNLALSPVIDGDFLPDHPGNLFHNAADIDYLAGVNSMDAHLFTGLDLPAVNKPIANLPLSDVKLLLGSLTKKGEASINSAFAEYTADWGDKPSQETIKKTVVMIETDYVFLVPTQAALYLHASNAQSARTYSYLFSEPSRLSGIVLPFPSWMEADHAEDLQFVFGKPFTTPLAYWPKHRNVSKYFIAYWTNFARTGDPNKGESNVPVTWPAYTTSGQKYLEINAKMNRNSVHEKMRVQVYPVVCF